MTAHAAQDRRTAYAAQDQRMTAHAAPDHAAPDRAAQDRAALAMMPRSPLARAAARSAPVAARSAPSAADAATRKRAHHEAPAHRYTPVTTVRCS